MPRSLAALALLALAAGAASAQVRIKDITDVTGARGNHLIGLGLVVGLDGTGSRSTFTQQMAADMLQKLGFTTQIFSPNPAESIIRSTNNSVVMVTAEIGPWSRKGTKIDVSVSSMDDARSLQGGKLLLTTLKGLDNEVYAVAQGEISIGGFAVSGQAAGVQKNQQNTGHITGGAMVEKEAPGELTRGGKLQFALKNPDYNTARLIAKAINARFPGSAEACDPGGVNVALPLDSKKSLSDLIGEIGLLEVKPDVEARVVINERTGTVVAGENVTLSPAAVAHGNLYLRVSELPQVSQPNPFGGGATAVVPRTQVGAVEERNRMVVLPRATTVADVARALNALGVTPRDLISIFKALKEAGALHAEVKQI
ncbi:MAG: flagellar basal body P-ring protein FlgI [Fimbriiglobus sp.]|nr:flagellar basal body P-ring protein FlgI [Fimbriiglobus sp.]